MASFLHVCRAEELPPGESAVVDRTAEPVAVFNMGGALYACTDTCPHAGGPLHDGFIDGTTVTCPWHGWCFDLAAGADAPPDGVTRLDVKVEDGEIYVQAPE